jgi:hypothetical protein
MRWGEEHDDDVREALADVDAEPRNARPRSLVLGTSTGVDVASSRSRHFGRAESMQLLERAIALDHEVLVLRPPRHPDRAVSCVMRASALRTCVRGTGELRLLDEAPVLGRGALGPCPPGNIEHAPARAVLAISLRARFEHMAGLAQLDEASALEREVLGLHPPDRLRRGVSGLARGAHGRDDVERARYDVKYDRTVGLRAAYLYPSTHIVVVTQILYPPRIPSRSRSGLAREDSARPLRGAALGLAKNAAVRIHLHARQRARHSGEDRRRTCGGVDLRERAVLVAEDNVRRGRDGLALRIAVRFERGPRRAPICARDQREVRLAAVRAHVVMSAVGGRPLLVAFRQQRLKVEHVTARPLGLGRERELELVRRHDRRREVLPCRQRA